MPVKNSSFASSWIDRDDAPARLEQIRSSHGEEVAENLKGFIENGFMILRNAIPKAAVQAYLKALQKQLTTKNNVKISLGSKIKTNSELDIGTPLTKILDTHVTLKESSKLFLN